MLTPRSAALLLAAWSLLLTACSAAPEAPVQAPTSPPGSVTSRSPVASPAVARVPATQVTLQTAADAPAELTVGGKTYARSTQTLPPDPRFTSLGRAAQGPELLLLLNAPPGSERLYAVRAGGEYVVYAERK